MNDFNEIIGHEQIKKHIKNAIKINKISHSYIIEGSAGMGKSKIANAIAKTIECEKGGQDPCNSCISCISFDHKNHPDVIYVNSTKKTGIGVDDIRDQINTDIYIKPYKYPYKIYIVNQADKMTIQAQNALLKTMEEPPSYAIIILLAENAKRFLPTILSRCVVLSLRGLTHSQIKNYLLKNYNLGEGQANIYASFSRGNLGKAKELVESTEFTQMRDTIIKLMDSICKNKDLDIIDISGILIEYKEKIDIILDLLLTWLRDLLIIKTMGDKNYLIHQDQFKTLLKQERILSYNRISILIKKIEETRTALNFNANFQATIETMVLNIDE